MSHSIFVMLSLLGHHDTPPVAAARGVLTRLLHDRAADFVLAEIPQENGLDVFQIEAKDGKVQIGGSSGVAIARGTYEYLRRACRSQVTWEASRLLLPRTLPDYPATRIVCPNRYRHYFNVCTFGYTTVWWDWARWEREIDWMALHGINMPLAMNGQEAIWQRVWRDMGLSDKELADYFTGPAFLPWHRMGNINGHAGPLPQDWIDRQKDLQRRILARERELGMSPIVPAFSGFVPPGLAKIKPEATITRSTAWAGFEPTYLLSPRDPLFIDIGERFIRAYRREFGSDHLYLADTFNEMTPRLDPATKLTDLEAVGDAVYRSIQAGDPDGTWVMQGWLFYNERAFWGEKEVRALLSKVPDDRMILIDLACEQMEVWRAHEAFRRKNWLYCTLHNFGQTTALFGDLDAYSRKPIAAQNDPHHGRLIGMGITPEGIEQNSVVYELLTDVMWRREPLDVDRWIADYCMCRYGGYPADMREAWRLIRRVIYGPHGLPRACMYMRRPTLDAGGYAGPEFVELQRILELYLACAGDLKDNPLYLRDLIDLTKRYLETVGGALVASALDAYEERDEARLKRDSARFLTLLDGLDTLLSMPPQYRLSNWIQSARQWGKDAKDADFYERNARLQVTVWGGPDLYDYAWKEWGGLTSNFYAQRWRQFFDALQKGVHDHSFDASAFARNIAAWENRWTQRKDLPSGALPRDTIALVRSLLKRFPDADRGSPIERGIAVGKPVTVSGGTEGTHEPRLAVDGDAAHPDSGWYASPYPQWLQIDLEQPTDIGSVHVFPYWDGVRHYQYTVDTSIDGNTWSRVVDMSKNTKAATRRGDRHAIPSTRARFVRVNMLFNSANIGVHLMEVRVFAAK